VSIVVAISGAAGLLGPAVARAFYEDGASLALAGRSKERLENLLDSIGAVPGRRLASAVDLSEAGGAERWAGDIREAFARVDVLLHLVGGYRGGTRLPDLPPTDWQELQGMLVLPTFHVVRAFAGPLRESRGRFIAVTSPKAQAPTTKSAVYSAAKAASDALVLALADELRGSGATSNLIVVDSIEAPNPTYGKSVSAAEIAATMRFLCSPEARSINGARVPLLGRGL
jgi:NAD(P)-dependent dehydrogenase (short-subunit alcohol dehydrogenase family)